MVTGNNVTYTPIIESDISNITHSTLIGEVMRITYTHSRPLRNY